MLPAKLSDRLRLLQWALSVAITLLAALYQLGPARYVYDHFGDWSHYTLEVFFYGTTGPMVIWLILHLVRQLLTAKGEERGRLRGFRPDPTTPNSSSPSAASATP